MSIAIDRSSLTDDAVTLLEQLCDAYGVQLQSAARAVAMARGSKVASADDLRKAQQHLLSGPLQTVQRIFELCNRSIKGGKLDGDCPAYDIRHICLTEINQMQSLFSDAPQR